MYRIQTRAWVHLLVDAGTAAEAIRKARTNGDFEIYLPGALNTHITGVALAPAITVQPPANSARATFVQD